MLEGSLFTIKSRKLSSDTENVFRISINPSHEVFDGHFEGRPIVPGVMILEIFKECALSCFEEVGNLRLRELSQARFTSLLEPFGNNDYIVRISLSEIDGSAKDNGEGTVFREWNFSARIESDSVSEAVKVYATAKGCLEGTCTSEADH